MSFTRAFGTISAIALCLGLTGCATELTPVEARARYDKVYADKGPRVKLDALSDPSHPVDPALRARWGFLADLPGKTFINRGFDSPILLTVEWQEKGKSMAFASRTLQGKHWDITSDVIVYSEALQRLHLSKHGPTGFPQANGAILFAGGPFSEFMLVPTVSGLFFVADVWQYLFVPYSKAKEEEFLASIRNKGEGVPLHIGIDKRVDGPELPPPTVLAVVRPQAQTLAQVQQPLAATASAPEIRKPAVRTKAVDKYLADLRSRIHLAAKACALDDIRIGGSIPSGKKLVEQIDVHYTAHCPGGVKASGVFQRYVGNGLSCSESDMLPTHIPCKAEDVSIKVDDVTPAE